MKTALLLLLSVATLNAQSYVNIRFPFFSGVPNTYTSTTNFIVPTNTIVRILNLMGTAELTGGSLSIRYPGAPAYPVDLGSSSFLNIPMLGPATNTITMSASGSGASATMLLQYETVNTAVNLGDTMIQPAGFTTSIALQSSLNLTTWTTITNAAFGKTNTARFFRMNQSIP